jgi:succinate-acetate transporter protein
VLLYAGAALLVPALASTLGKLVPALVLFTASARYIISGIYQLNGSPAVQTAAGIAGLVLLGVALYAALALALEDVQRKTTLPVLRLGMGKQSLRGPAAAQVAGVENEAGVREQL